MRRIALLLMVFVWGLAASPLAQINPGTEPELIGNYTCEGLNADGKPYSGTVEIQKHGQVFHLRWQLGSGEDSYGLGIIVGGRLSVMAFAIDNDHKAVLAQTVAVCSVKDADPFTLEGSWAGPFTDGIYSETLTKVTPEHPAKKPLPKPTHRL